MFCDKCGKMIKEGAAFCPYCGRKISDSIVINPDKQETDGESSLPNPSENQEGYVSVTLPSKKRVGIILCFAAALLILIGAYQVLSSNYRFYVDFYNECIDNQMDLGNNIYSQRLSRTYDGWIAEYGAKIRACKVRAVSYSIIGIVCGVFGFYLIKKDYRKNE